MVLRWGRRLTPSEIGVAGSYTDGIMPKTATPSAPSVTSLKSQLKKVTEREGTARERKEELIRILRTEHSMSLRNLAELTDVSHTGIARICGESD